MKKTLRHLFAYAATVGLCLLAACSTDTPTDEQQKTDWLTAQPWRLATATVTPELYSPILNGTTTDYFTYFVPNCVYDNYWLFSTNQTYETNEGLTFCQPTDPQTVVREWSFSLTLDAINTAQANGDEPINYQLLALTDQRLEVRYTLTVNSDDYTIEAMYLHAN